MTISYSSIIKKALSLKKDHPELRLGQLVFNITYDISSGKADKLRSTKFDCYYDDNKIYIYIEKFCEDL